ncbi:4-hydroxythreonine-4-phosphate dehydrogenase PdxA [bacterium]|nr:4-hydroxythreonine-4-phosphate dehydrogenase PdxA [bacterium]
MDKIAISLGDINGISPEITIKALNSLDIEPENVVIVGSNVVFDYYKTRFGLTLRENFEIIEVPLKYEDITPGKETKEAGEFSFQCLKKATELAKEGEVKAIVTAPLSKNAINMCGYHFSGQTEVLEKYLAHDGQKAEMLFVSPKIKVLLLTRHTSLLNAVKSVKKEILAEKTEKLNFSLSSWFNIKSPEITVCALNPHASEGGLFGEEEEKEIIPALQILKEKGIKVSGPFPSDTLFQKVIEGKIQTDCVVALYHDQGLIPLKLMGFDDLVNATIGLDVLRTSPAHGTAFDIAGKNIANPNSMKSAIKLALGLKL